ncbi:MAG: hypothetical protein WCY05_04060 [Candidatus Omnitrophota bacterium]
MITIAVSILVMLSLLLSAFLGFAPQLHKLVENDLMRRSYNNSLIYGLQLGQIGIRAKTLTVDPKTNKPVDLPFRTAYETGEVQGKVQDRFVGDVSLKDNAGNLEINVNIDHQFK